MKDRLIIGIAGKYQIRKEIACSEITAMNFDRVSISNKVRKVARESFNWDGDFSEYGKRILLEVSNCGRKIHEDYWMFYALNRILITNDGNPVVVPDLRYDNEVDTIHAINGHVLFIGSRNDIEEYKKLKSGARVDCFIEDIGDDIKLRKDTVAFLMSVTQQSRSAGA